MLNTEPPYRELNRFTAMIKIVLEILIPFFLQVLRITAWSLSKSAYEKTHKTGLQQKIFLTSNLYHSTINLRVSTWWRSYWNILTVNLYLEMMLFFSSNNCLTLWYMLYFVTDLMPLCNLKARSLCSVFLSDFVMIYDVSLHNKFWRSMKFASLSLPLSIVRRQFHMVKKFCGIYYWSQKSKILAKIVYVIFSTKSWNSSLLLTTDKVVHFKGLEIILHAILDMLLNYKKNSKETFCDGVRKITPEKITLPTHTKLPRERCLFPKLFN